MASLDSPPPNASSSPSDSKQRKDLSIHEQFVEVHISEPPQDVERAQTSAETGNGFDIVKDLKDLGLRVAEEDEASYASKDFGGVYVGQRARAVVKARSTEDVQKAVEYGRRKGIKVAARGNGHSVYGQAMAEGGVVVDMRGVTLEKAKVEVRAEEGYVEAAGGQLWIEVLRECVEEGVAPVSWPDYLYLTVGGTIQTAGVGGQSFKQGPVISNVLQLHVVTGMGEVKICDEKQNAELFYAMLGGLGQFGIITKARIRVEKAPTMVRWIRLVYSDASSFSNDQIMAITLADFDFVEGFVISNNPLDPVNGWPQLAFSPHHPLHLDPSHVPPTAGPFLYCLELVKYYPHHITHHDPIEAAAAISAMDEEVKKLQAQFKHIRELTFSKDVPYIDFLNRVHDQELALSELGMWQIPHPWLCLFIPLSYIQSLDTLIFKTKLTKGIGGPILMYPMLKSKWVERSSAITPDEDIFYIIGLLRSSYNGFTLEASLQENDEIIHILESHNIPFKLYMPQFKSPPRDSQLHFGKFWESFVHLKQTYDPLHILAPGQQIFQMARPSSS